MIPIYVIKSDQNSNIYKTLNYGGLINMYRLVKNVEFTKPPNVYLSSTSEICDLIQKDQSNESLLKDWMGSDLKVLIKGPCEYEISPKRISNIQNQTYNYVVQVDCSKSPYSQNKTVITGIHITYEDLFEKEVSEYYSLEIWGYSESIPPTNQTEACALSNYIISYPNTLTFYKGFKFDCPAENIALEKTSGTLINGQDFYPVIGQYTILTQPNNEKLYVIYKSNQYNDYIDSSKFYGNMPVTLHPKNEKILSISTTLAGGTDNVGDSISTIADYVSNEITYTLFDGAWNWNSDLDVLEKKHGACVDYSALFSSMSRSLGIPVRGILSTNKQLLGTGHEYVEYYDGGKWHHLEPQTNHVNKPDMYLRQNSWSYAHSLNLTTINDSTMQNFLQSYRIAHWYVDPEGEPQKDEKTSFLYGVGFAGPGLMSDVDQYTKKKACGENISSRISFGNFIYEDCGILCLPPQLDQYNAKNVKFGFRDIDNIIIYPKVIYRKDVLKPGDYYMETFNFSLDNCSRSGSTEIYLIYDTPSGETITKTSKLILEP